MPGASATRAASSRLASATTRAQPAQREAWVASAGSSGSPRATFSWVSLQMSMGAPLVRRFDCGSAVGPAGAVTEGGPQLLARSVDAGLHRPDCAALDGSDLL